MSVATAEAGRARRPCCCLQRQAISEQGWHWLWRLETSAQRPPTAPCGPPVCRWRTAPLALRGAGPACILTEPRFSAVGGGPQGLGTPAPACRAEAAWWRAREQLGAVPLGSEGPGRAVAACEGEPGVPTCPRPSAPWPAPRAPGSLGADTGRLQGCQGPWREHSPAHPAPLGPRTPPWAHTRAWGQA